MRLPDCVEPLSQGLFAIDTGFHRPRFDAAFLVVNQGRAAFIDTGTNHSVPRLLEALDALDIDRRAVDWIVPTHVHLDHAGGTGLLLSQLPQARVLVHPRGAPHLVDPSRLLSSATAVYGPEEIQRSYGTLVRVPPDRIERSRDEQTFWVGRRPLQVLHTPGHARHHHCIWDTTTQGWFTGDTFGLSYREFDVEGRPWILPTSTPVQFEPQVLKASIARLLARLPQRMYLTHYSVVTEPQRLAEQLLAQLDRMLVIAADAPGDESRHDWLKREFAQLYLGSAREHGCPGDAAEILSELAMDIELNAQGVGIWLDKRNRIDTAVHRRPA